MCPHRQTQIAIAWNNWKGLPAPRLATETAPASLGPYQNSDRLTTAFIADELFYDFPRDRWTGNRIQAGFSAD
jgi:hypothetical protein